MRGLSRMDSQLAVLVGGESSIIYQATYWGSRPLAHSTENRALIGALVFTRILHNTSSFLEGGSPLSLVNLDIDLAHLIEVDLAISIRVNVAESFFQVVDIDIFDPLQVVIVVVKDVLELVLVDQLIVIGIIVAKDLCHLGKGLLRVDLAVFLGLHQDQQVCHLALVDLTILISVSVTEDVIIVAQVNAGILLH